MVGPGVGASKSMIDKLSLKAGVERKVYVVGPAMGDTKLKYMAGADLFVTPSRHEGLPMTVLEAMGVGARCLVSQGTNLASDVRKWNCGWVCESSSVSISDSISEALMDLNEKGRKKAISQAAKNMIKEKYDWSILSEKFISAYLEVLKVVTSKI